MSGISREPLRYDRLLSSYRLERFEGRFVFLPSSRALSTIEDFCHRYTNLYKYVVFHHTVAKSDGLFEDALVKIAKDYLASAESEADKYRDISGGETAGEESRSTLPYQINGLWAVLHKDRTALKQEFINNFIQWDDAWLLSVLRQHYFHLRSNRSAGDPTILEVMLEEILSNRKNYESLFKREDSFIITDEALVRSVPGDFDWANLARYLGVEDKLNAYREVKAQGLAQGGAGNSLGSEASHEERLADLDELQEYYRSYSGCLSEPRQPIELARLREQRGFFFVSLRAVLASFGFGGAHGDSILLSSAKRALMREFNLDDVVLIPKFLKRAVYENQDILIDGDCKQIGEVSRIADDLQRTARLFTPFYIYTFRQGQDLEKRALEMREYFGRAIWQALEETITP